MFKKGKIKDRHLHFAHGWIWGMVALALLLLVVVGIRDGYFHYWLSGDFRIVNVHEGVQSAREAETLYDAMRKVNIHSVVLVGTPNEIIYYSGEAGFTGYEQNNEEILEIQASNPKRFIAFCTVDVQDPNYMTVVQECMEQGAKGFKIYSGHSLFYTKPLDDAGIYDFYAYLQENQLPLIFHVNTGKYQEEFENVLALYPEMKVVCPHFCLTSTNLQRLSYLLDTYSNLYVDIGFGSAAYLAEGIERISEDPTAYRDFITKYADRFFYGTDTVVTDYEGKDEEWLGQIFQTYRNLLEEETYQYFLSEDPDREYNGLALDNDVLEKIYETNWENLLSTTP